MFQFQCIQQHLESEQCDLCDVSVVENKSSSNHSHAGHFEQNDDLYKVVVQLCAEILQNKSDSDWLKILRWPQLRPLHCNRGLPQGDALFPDLFTLC